VEAGAARAIKALQAAVRQGGTDALLQTPLESIVGNDSLGLHTVRQALELERRIVASRLAALKQSGEPPAEPMVSYFTSINAGWDDGDFDSGAETEAGGSDATDVDSDVGA
jgi:lysozyme family protein